MANEKKEQNVLGGILLGLVIIIVGLIIGIIVVKKRNEIVYNCENAGGLYEIGVCLQDALEQGVDYNSIAVMYRKAIDSAKEKNDYKLASDLIAQRIDKLVIVGDCDGAIELTKNEDLNGYSKELMGRIYSYAASASVECGNEEAFSMWNKLMDNIREENRNEENL